MAFACAMPVGVGLTASAVLKASTCEVPMPLHNFTTDPNWKNFGLQ